MHKLSEIIGIPFDKMNADDLLDGWQQLLQLEFPEDVAHHIIAFRTELHRRAAEPQRWRDVKVEQLARRLALEGIGRTGADLESKFTVILAEVLQ